MVPVLALSDVTYRLFDQMLDLSLCLVEEGLAEHGAGQLDWQLAVQTERLTGAQCALSREPVQVPGEGRVLCQRIVNKF